MGGGVADRGGGRGERQLAGAGRHRAGTCGAVTRVRARFGMHPLAASMLTATFQGITIHTDFERCRRSVRGAAERTGAESS